MVNVPLGPNVFPRPLRLSAGSEGPSPGVAFLRMLLKRAALVVAAMTLGVGGSLLYSATSATMYRAETTIEIDAAPIRPLGEKTTDVRDMGAEGYWNPAEYYETQYKIMVSDRVLGAVVRQLGLAQEFGQKAPKDLSPFEAALGKLRGEVTIEPVKNSHLVLIKVEDRSPPRARQLADTVASAFMEENLKGAVNASGDALTWIGGQVDHARRDLIESENALHEFKRANELPSTSINEASNMLRVEMQEYDLALTRTRTKKQELLARKAQLLKVDAEHSDTLPASELLGSSFLQSLRNQYVEATKQRAGLIASGKGENHPLVMEAVNRAEETKAALLAEVRRIRRIKRKTEKKRA